MSWTRDLLQAIFFAASAFAILVGAAIAFWRFVLHRPFGPAWDVVMPAECRVRRVSRDEYVYHVVCEIVNLSALPQRPMRNWMALSFPGEEAFRAPIPPIRTPGEASQHVAADFATAGAWVPSGGRTTWVRTQPRAQLHHAVRFKLAFETRPRRWFGLLLHSDPLMKFAASTVPVNTEDIDLYDKEAGLPST